MQHLLLAILCSSIGAALTFLLQKQGIPAVLAASLLGFIGTGVSYLLHIPSVAFVVFAGAFVGMTSPNIASLPLVVLGGGLTGILYHFSTNAFVGFGGRLGVIAFVSVLVCTIVAMVMKKIY